MKPKKNYRSSASSGINAKLPRIETWASQFPHTTITIVDPEYNAICPKTGLPDFGTLIIRYVPDNECLELKSLKEYILSYRNLGIFYENAVNRVLRDMIAACHPKWAVVRGDFTARGGIQTTVEARYPSAKNRGRSRS